MDRVHGFAAGLVVHAARPRMSVVVDVAGSGGLSAVSVAAEAGLKVPAACPRVRAEEEKVAHA